MGYAPFFELNIIFSFVIQLSLEYILFRKLSLNKSSRYVWTDISKYGYDLFVSRQPIYGIEFFIRKPSGVFMLKKFKFATLKRTKIAMHYKMELWIVIFYGTKPVSNCYLRCKFFTYLPLQCFYWFLSGLNFSTGKLPPTLPFAIPASRRERKTVTLNDGGHDFYYLHKPIPFKPISLTVGSTFETQAANRQKAITPKEPAKIYQATNLHKKEVRSSFLTMLLNISIKHLNI